MPNLSDLKLFSGLQMCIEREAMLGGERLGKKAPCPGTTGPAPGTLPLS